MKIDLLLKKVKDKQLVYELFCSHKIKELSAETWPENMKQQICLMQFNAFESSLKTQNSQIEDLIITLNSISIGRLIFSVSESCILIKYISLLPEYQKKGIGKRILNLMIEKAKNLNKEISLNVSKDNPVYYLYKKLGFIIVDNDEINYTMKYTP